MKFAFILTVLTMLSPIAVLAYQPQLVDLKTPFELESLDTIQAEQWFVGELSGFPHTFEFELKEPTELAITLLVLMEPEAPKVSFIAVKEVRRGVEEVTRINRDLTSWTPFTDPRSRLDFLVSESFSEILAPGVYRMEVNNPINEGQYILSVGTDQSAEGYISALQNTIRLRSYLGLSPWGVLLTRQVLIPLFAVVSVVYIGIYLRRRGRVVN